MSRTVNEKVILVESLTVLPPDPGWDAVEARFSGRTDDCQPMARLIELKRGLLCATDAELVEGHARVCPYCGPWVWGFRRVEGFSVPDAVLDEDEEPLPARHRPGVPVPAPVGDVVLTHSGTLLSEFLQVHRPRQMLAKLRPILAELLADIGLSRDLAERFQEFARASAPTACPENTVWLPWILERFARDSLGLERLPGVPDSASWEKVLEPSARRLLAMYPPNTFVDPSDALKFRQHRLGERTIDPDRAIGPQDQERLAKETDINPDAVAELMRQEHRSLRTLMARSRTPVEKR